MCCRAHPADVEGYDRGFRHWLIEVEQSVGDIEEVSDVDVRRRHPRLTVLQVYGHTVLALVIVRPGPALTVVTGPERYRPEQAARVGMDPGVEVVHLGGEVLEVEPTSVEIQSNKTERSPMDGAILAYVDALHKPHIGVEEERLDAAVGIPGGAFSPHIRDTDKAFEIGD